jgi:carboxyl-terminal processing protease
LKKSISCKENGRSVERRPWRREDQPGRPLVVTPRKIDPRHDWLEAQKLGSRVTEVRGKKVAYMPFFSAAGERHQDLLREEIVGRFADADALILDFRNGWGGANPSFVNLFSKVPPRLEYIGRDGTRRPYDAQWRKPLFVLINEGSTSGKEVVAFAIKKYRLGQLVGQRTAGAVLAGSVFLLGDKTLLYLAVSDVVVDGERLEGRGVAPDVEVHDFLPFARGNDPQLEKAIQLAAP